MKAVYCFSKSALLIFLFLPGILRGQTNGPFIYLDGGVSFGQNSLSYAGLNCIYKKHHIAAVVYSYSKDARFIPPDYAPGLVLFGPSKPQSILTAYGLTYGRAWNTYNPYVRFICRGGLLIGSYTYPDSFVKNPLPGWGSNYDFERVGETAVSLIIHPAIQLPTRYVGVSLGAFAIYSKQSSGMGANVSLSLGHLRERLNSSNNNYTNGNHRNRMP